MSDIDSALLRLKSTIESVKNLADKIPEDEKEDRTDELLKVTFNTLEQCEIWLQGIRDEAEHNREKNRARS